MKYVADVHILRAAISKRAPDHGHSPTHALLYAVDCNHATLAPPSDSLGSPSQQQPVTRGHEHQDIGLLNHTAPRHLQLRIHECQLAATNGRTGSESAALAGGNLGV